MAIIKNCNFDGVNVGYFRVNHVRVNVTDETAVVGVVGWVNEVSAVAGETSIWGTHTTVPLVALADLDGILLAMPEFVGASRVGTTGAAIDAAKRRRWALFKARRQELDESPMPLRDFHVDADASSRQDLMGAIMAMQLTGETSRVWRCSDNVMRELSFSDIVTVGVGIAARRQTLIETSDTLYQQIQSATTVEEVEAVTWPE